MKDKIKIIIGIFVLTGFFITVVCYNFKIKRIISQKDSQIVSLEDSLNSDAISTKYDFLEDSVACYIESLCNELNVDSDLVVGILMVENPTFDVNAINRNINGTIDCGLFQLNDRYLWTNFKKDYWIEDLELDPFNWKHNAYIAIHHIKYLQDKLKIKDETIMAYNCGIWAVMNHAIPESSRVYLAKVNNNIKLLKKLEKTDF